MARLVVQELSKGFARGSSVTLALRDVSFTLEEGEFATIVGPSGCGKSTLLHIIGGFVQPNGGTIFLDDRQIADPGRDRGMMFQDFALFPWRSVIGNVSWALEIEGLPKAERLRRAEHCLKLVDLERFRNHYPHELSGGMKQRVALARLLAFEPKVLLMDEPFGSLDAQTRELLQEELTKIWDRTGKTILFVTHDIEEAVYLGDRVFVFTSRPGTIKEEVPIPIPRLRGIEVKKSKAFADCRNYIWDLLREEVLKARTL